MFINKVFDNKPGETRSAEAYMHTFLNQHPSLDYAFYLIRKIEGKKQQRPFFQFSLYHSVEGELCETPQQFDFVTHPSGIKQEGVVYIAEDNLSELHKGTISSNRQKGVPATYAKTCKKLRSIHQDHHHFLKQVTPQLIKNMQRQPTPPEQKTIPKKKKHASAESLIEKFNIALDTVLDELKGENQAEKLQRLFVRLEQKHFAKRRIRSTSTYKTFHHKLNTLFSIIGESQKNGFKDKLLLTLHKQISAYQTPEANTSVSTVSSEDSSSAEVSPKTSPRLNTSGLFKPLTTQSTVRSTFKTLSIAQRTPGQRMFKVNSGGDSSEPFSYFSVQPF